MKPKTLHLVLTRYWFDRYVSGRKRCEFREYTAYWRKRLAGKSWDYVCFHRGYTAETITFRWVKTQKRRFRGITFFVIQVKDLPIFT